MQRERYDPEEQRRKVVAANAELARYKTTFNAIMPVLSLLGLAGFITAAIYLAYL
nr:phage tail protein [Microvirga sp. Mcv34]